MTPIITRRPARTIISSVVALLLGTATTTAMASAFQLYQELNGVNAGNFGAGAAAEAADASTSYFNPAGLVYIQHDQVVGAGNIIFASSKFTGTDTWNTFPPTRFSYTESASGLQGGGTFFIPALYYAHPISDNLVFGVSLNSPFGLSTDWDDTSAVRYADTRTDLKVYDLSPALGGKLTDSLSIGGGLDFDYSTVEFDAVAGVPGLPIFPDPTSHDANATNKGSAFGVGAHLGIMYQINAATRVGINYASAVKMHYTGTSTTGSEIYADGQSFTSNSLYSDATLPATTTASFYHAFNQRLALLGSATYTQWSSVQDLVLYNVAGATPELEPELIVVDAPQNFRDTWRLAIGANYRCTDKFMLRVGGGWDENPTNDTDRSLRLPDANRIGLSIGGHYQYNQAVGFDVGYTHLFVPNSNINNTAIIGGQQATVVGTTDNDANILGGSVTWNIN